MFPMSVLVQLWSVQRSASLPKDGANSSNKCHWIYKMPLNVPESVLVCSNGANSSKSGSFGAVGAVGAFEGDPNKLDANFFLGDTV
jgi:hypothetical protein